jgi:subtilisin family serine protease
MQQRETFWNASNSSGSHARDDRARWSFIGFAGLAAAACVTMCTTPGLAADSTGLNGPVAIGPHQQGPSQFHPAHVNVRTKPGADVAALDAKVGVVKVLYESRLVPGLRCVEVAPGSVMASIDMYRADPAVLYANPDYFVRAAAQSTPYGVVSVNAPAHWPTGLGEGCITSNLDTGIDLAHPDLPVPNQTVSFVPGQAVDDAHGHGTHTAGTIAAIDNTIGVIGVAPDVTLIAGKVLSDDGEGLNSWVAAGIDWSVANGARVINMSLGGPDFDQGLSDSCDAALAAGVLVVAAAGNDNSSALFYPAAHASVLAVAAVDSSNNRAGFSNFGPHISLSAPGVSTLSTYVACNVIWDNAGHTSRRLEGSGSGVVSGMAIYCSLGLSASDFPPEVAGNIAHIRRGSATFTEKVNNALAAGAIAVIVSNNNGGAFTGTLSEPASIPVVSIGQSDGNALQTASGVLTTINTSGWHGYANSNGTSMAAPHVSGVASLLFGLYPEATPAQVREAMEETATDLGAPSRDDLYGYGLVNAEAARVRLECILAGCDACPTCAADYDNNGGVDGGDLAAFFTDFEAGASCADVDANGGVDGGDLATFFQVFEAGGC